MAIRGRYQEDRKASSIADDVKKQNKKKKVVDKHNTRNMALIEEARKYGIPDEVLNEYNADVRKYHDGFRERPYSSIKGRTGKLNPGLDSLIDEYVRNGYGGTELGRARARSIRTPVWIRDAHNLNNIKHMENVYLAAKKSGQAVDHGLPLLGKQVSGLDVPQNLSGMDPKANMSKGNRLPDDFLDWEWRHDPRTAGASPGKGRLSAWRQGAEGLERVPKSQGGLINANLLKNVGKIGLLGAAEMGLNYLAPDNPINQSRDRGYEALMDVGLDLEGAIEGIENPMLRAPAHLANGLLADPFITALGAGANMGDRIRKEWTGENIRPNITKDGPAMQGRFNQRGLLDG